MKHLRALLVGLLLATAHVHAQQPVPLIDLSQKLGGWGFSDGREFPGASGSLTVDESAKDGGHATLKLSGNFEKGGAYVNLGRRLPNVPVHAIRFRLRAPGRDALGLQITDGSGQTHQMQLGLARSDDWQEATLPLEDFFARRGQADAVTTVSRYETWGGAKDGKWHGAATGLYVFLSPTESTKTPVLWVSAIDVVPPVFAFSADFGEKLGAGWKTEGRVSTAEGALVLDRPLEALEQACAATSPAFPVSSGTWAVAARAKAKLASPDNSYRGTVSLVVSDAAGRELGRHPVGEVSGEREWVPLVASVRLLPGAATARVEARLDKAHGTLWLDDVTVRRTGDLPRDEAVATRLLFSTAQLGNLLFPADPRDVRVEARARRALNVAERTVTWVARTYWGSELAPPATVTLGEGAEKDGAWRHEGRLDLSALPLELGRYYEVHAEVRGAATDEPLRHSTSLAILPEAQTKQHAPEDVPFTSRNWDNRLTEYIRLTDRLGVRTVGLWGGWSLEPPYNPELPGLEEAKRLGLRWLTNTPAARVERGEAPLDDAALREGAKRFIQTHGGRGPYVVNLGNEPHGTGDKVIRNVAAYRAVYQGVKAADPGAFVVATSVEPNEEYFRAGYGKWCDAFDFHIYETAADVRRTMRDYRALMKKYGVEKPLWSTELGLNSQGMARHTVAAEVWRKTAAFFAEGGACMSWFGLLYPDKDGTSFGSSGDSHNMFDCRFNRYAPRLDAIAWYNAVNGVSVKKFAGERTYASGVQATHFRDGAGAHLLFVWSEAATVDVTLPVPGAGKVTAISLDGRRAEFAGASGAVTLTLSPEPCLVLFRSGEFSLPAKMEPAPAQMTAEPEGGGVRVTLPEGVAPVLPPCWRAERAGGGAWRLVPAFPTETRELEVLAPLPGARGELHRRLPLTAR